tara:strand:+ start:505 stop:843 length:339 start_codon:yes stop_codon:yes gene_type:complete
MNNMKPKNPSDLTNFVNGYIRGALETGPGILGRLADYDSLAPRGLFEDTWVQYSDEIDINIFMDDQDVSDTIQATAYPLHKNEDGGYQTDCSGNFYSIENIAQFPQNIKQEI